MNQNKISIENEVEKEEDDQEDVIEEIDDLIREDPVMEFHLSEEENEENNENRYVRTEIILFLFDDISELCFLSSKNVVF